MNTHEQISKALGELEPSPEKRDECRHDIEVALGRIEEAVRAARSFKRMGSKLGKRQLESYRTALNRLQTAYDALDSSIRPWFGLFQAGFASGGETVIDRELRTVNALLDRPSQPSGGRDASVKEAAVAAAHDLLEFWGHSAGCTRNGKWERLARLLAGDESLDLFDHLREFNSRPALTLVRIEDAEGSIIKLIRR